MKCEVTAAALFSMIEANGIGRYVDDIKEHLRCTGRWGWGEMGRILWGIYPVGSFSNCSLDLAEHLTCRRHPKNEDVVTKCLGHSSPSP